MTNVRLLWVEEKCFSKLAAPLFWQLIYSPRIQDGGPFISTQLFTQCTCHQRFFCINGAIEPAP